MTQIAKSQVAKRCSKKHIIMALKRQCWLLFIAIILVMMGESMLKPLQASSEQASVLLWSKGFALGALLNYLGTWIFAVFTFRHTGSQARQRIVYHMYLGEMAKWTISLLGFALIFITITPLNALAVFIGFMAMHIGFSWISLRTL